MARVIQSLLFSKKKFSRKQALDWAKEHKYKHYTSRETKGQIRVRQLPLVQVKKVLGTFSLGKDIKAVYVLKKGRN